VSSALSLSFLTRAQGQANLYRASGYYYPTPRGYCARMHESSVPSEQPNRLRWAAITCAKLIFSSNWDLSTRKVTTVRLYLMDGPPRQQHLTPLAEVILGRTGALFCIRYRQLPPARSRRKAGTEHDLQFIELVITAGLPTHDDRKFEQQCCTLYGVD